jgi:ribonuclease P protein component
VTPKAPIVFDILIDIYGSVWLFSRVQRNSNIRGRWSSDREHPTIKEVKNEKNVSTEQNQTGANAWVSQANVHQGWAPRAEPAARKRSQASGLITCAGRGRVNNATPASYPVIQFLTIATRRICFRVAWEPNDPAARLTFTKADRLLRRSEFLHLAQHGKKVQNRDFIAYTGSNDLNRCRLGITVTRKVGKAAVRNRIKRITRTYFRLNRHTLRNSRDISIIAKKSAADIPNERAVLSLGSLFEQIKETRDR